MSAFVSSANGRNRDDLHIDDIDPEFTDQVVWLGAAVDCLVAAASSVVVHDWPITVAMEFFIEPSGSPEDIGALGLDELSTRWSPTPPALTVYRRGVEPWTAKSSFTRVQLEINDHRLHELQVDAYFQEWFDDADRIYDKRLWLVVA